MLELTWTDNIGFTGVLFNPEFMIGSIVSDDSKYYYIIGILSNHRLFRFANVSRHLSGHRLISHITVYPGLPGYHDITPNHASLFISVCQNITASNSYRREIHSWCQYWLDTLCMCFNYLILPRYYDLINRLCRVCVLRNISACFLALPVVAKCLVCP